MMFEAFGFMQEPSCTAEKPSQLPSVEILPFYLTFFLFLSFHFHCADDILFQSVSLHVSVYLSTNLYLNDD